MLWRTAVAIMEQVCYHARVWQYTSADRVEYLGMVFILRICSRDKDFACNIVWLGAGIKGRMMIASHLLPEQ